MLSIFKRDNLFPSLLIAGSTGFLSKIHECLTLATFLVFSVMSVRIILGYGQILLPVHLALLVVLLLSIGILSWWQPLECLYAFVASIPLICGLQALGVANSLSLLSLIFASIFLSWFSRRIFYAQDSLRSRTVVGLLIDVLAGMTLLSLIMITSPFPWEMVWHNFWSIPSGDQSSPFWGIEAAYILLQGFIFFRILELEAENKLSGRNILFIFYFHCGTIFFFSIYQYIFKVPAMFLNIALNSPFEDKNSYASYLAILFSVFFYLAYNAEKKKKGHALLTGITLIFLIWSYSRAAWLAIMVILVIYFSLKLSSSKKAIILLVFSLFLLLCLWPPAHFGSLLNRITAYTQIDFSRFNLPGRNVMWHRAISIMEQHPFTGSGIGTYFRISPLYQDSRITEMRDHFENAHNYFLQYGSEMGIPALVLFLTALLGVYKPALGGQQYESAPLVKGLLMGFSAYLLTCIAGHPLILPTQQFLFWFIVAGIILLTPPKMPPYRDKMKNLFAKAKWILVGGLIFSVIAYGNRIVNLDEPIKEYEYGFYNYEDWQGRKVRWTEKEAVSKKITPGRLLSFDIYTMEYNIGKEGLIFKLFINNRLWDEINFKKSEKRTLKYFLSREGEKSIEIKTVVNKTFNPYKLKLNSDRRNLGVAVSEFRFSME